MSSIITNTNTNNSSSKNKTAKESLSSSMMFFNNSTANNNSSNGYTSSNSNDDNNMSLHAGDHIISINDIDTMHMNSKNAHKLLKKYKKMKYRKITVLSLVRL